MIASKAPTLTLMVLMLVVLAGCTMFSPEADECGDGASCAKQTPRTEQQAARQEPTVYPKQVLTGIITKRGEGLFQFREKPGSWMLVEQNPNVDCSRHKRPVRPGCIKMYFNITARSDVYQEKGNSIAQVPAARLKKGQKVRADYTGYDVAESYFGQTTARKVVILDTN